MLWTFLLWLRTPMTQKSAWAEQSLPPDDSIFELFGNTGEHLATCPGDENVVLDSDAAPPWEVDPRLDGHHHSRLEHGFALGRQPGPFMNL